MLINQLKKLKQRICRGKFIKDSNYIIAMNNINPLLPREEWAILMDKVSAQQKLIQQHNKLALKQRKREYKSQLDLQVRQVQLKKKRQKELDDRHYQLMMAQVAQQQEQQRFRTEAESRKKYNQLQELKEQLEWKRISHLQKVKSQKLIPSLSSLPNIGMQMVKGGKANLNEFYQQQINAKIERKHYQVQAEREMQRAMHQRDRQLELTRLKHQQKITKGYKQNFDVYRQYEQLYFEKKRSEEDKQRQIVENERRHHTQAREAELYLQKKKEQNRKAYRQQILREIQIKQRRQEQEKASRLSPMPSQVREQARPTQNKEQYLMYLQRQAEQKRHRKITDRYMTENEVRLNGGELKRVVSDQALGYQAGPIYIGRRHNQNLKSSSVLAQPHQLEHVRDRVRLLQ